MKRRDVKRLSRAFKALSNPNRLQIFMNLLNQQQIGATHDCFLANILGNLSIGAPTVSHHVKELADADLIRTEKEGKQLICSVNPAMMEELRTLFEELE